MIPQEKKTAVTTALQTAFGVSEFQEIRELTGGLSPALVFRVVVLGKPYLLRIITRTDAMNDPTHQFACMEVAEKAWLAPRVWYTSIADRISITAFIDAKEFSLNEAKTKMPELLRRLHSLPPFPFRIDYLEAVDGFVKKFRAAKILPESVTAALFRQYERIRNVYPRDKDDLVACHNDLKPENILFDGDKVWLVDWEAAFLNDRYSDLAIVGNFLVTNEEEEKDFLKRYLGGDVSEYHLARFFLMRQLHHTSYFTFFMLLCAGAGHTIDLSLPVPGFREFHDNMWAGKISLADTVARLQYAQVHMEHLRHNLGLKRFDDSLRIVANYQLIKK